MTKKTVLSNKIYLNCTVGSELEAKLEKELIYSIDQRPQSDYPLIIRHIVRVSDNIVAIPSGRQDLIPEGCTIIDKRTYTDAVIPDPSFTLRGDQAQAVEYFEDGKSGILNCKPGWGKSIAALGLIHRVQLKTLIVCTTTVIRDMWIKEVEKWFNIEPCVIGGGSIKNEDSPIAIGNIQTVTKYKQELSSKFGMVIIDECHHCSAKTFDEVLTRSRASIKIGLSGTLKRKDGKHCLFKDYFSGNVYAGKDVNTLAPTVHSYESSAELSGNAMIPWALKVNKLYEDSSYVSLLAMLAKSYSAMGHKVLLVLDRVELIQTLLEHIPKSVGITGEINSTTELREEVSKGIYSGEYKVLIATQSIFSEGVSMNPLSCLILGAPVSNEGLTEQLAGRIQRKHENKLDPILVDVKLSGNTGRRQFNTRRGVYIREGWNIVKMNEAKLINKVTNYARNI